MGTGQIFDVKHYAINDGPGIRTTFFFQGCLLRCAWCQNPESRPWESFVEVDEARCIGCGRCRTCQAVDETGKRLRKRCAGCFECVKNCPTGALRLLGRETTVEELLAIALEERPFYESSGGGVTCSGGECLLQAAFVTDVLAACRERGIHTAVDTCGQVPYAALAMTVPYTNLYLYDIKLMDAEQHRRYTGQSNDVILENLRRLYDGGSDIRIRIPLIPGITDTEENIGAIADWMRRNTPRLSAELLQYNSLAESKYGKRPFYDDDVPEAYPLAERALVPETPEQMERLRSILLQAGIQASCLVWSGGARHEQLK